MNGLDLLRWVLLVIGVAILIGVYVAGHRSIGARLRRRRSERAEPPQIEVEAGAESLTVPDPELAELGRTIRIDDSAESSLEQAPVAPIKVERRPARRPASTPARASRDPAPRPATKPAEPKIVVVYVVAPTGMPFHGADVFEAARHAGLEYGDMAIFHHHVSVDGERQSLFSMANMVEPGSFDAEQREQLQTPGLALFLQLPGAMEGARAFDLMIEAAQTLKRELGGELRDATRSVMSHQTIAHLRDEISEYERLQRAHSGVR